MINPLRQFVSAALTFALLSANGFYFAPLLKTLQGDKESASMQKCCCCNSGGGMSPDCCCASRHSKGNDRTTCSISSTPCGTPVAVLSPNVLDQGIETQPPSSSNIEARRSEKFPGTAELPLPGTPHSLFHPPDSLPLLHS